MELDSSLDIFGLLQIAGNVEPYTVVEETQLDAALYFLDAFRFDKQTRYAVRFECVDQIFIDSHEAMVTIDVNSGRFELLSVYQITAELPTSLSRPMAIRSKLERQILKALCQRRWQ